MATFRINYNKVISQANTMKNLSTELEREIQRLEEVLADVKGNWHGPASQEYQRKLIALIDDMKSTKRDMYNVSNTIKIVANRIRNEDQQIAEMSAKL